MYQYLNLPQDVLQCILKSAESWSYNSCLERRHLNKNPWKHDLIISKIEEIVCFGIDRKQSHPVQENLPVQPVFHKDGFWQIVRHGVRENDYFLHW